jgi:ribosomal protein S27E
MAKDWKPWFERLKDPRWQRRRLEILQSANFKCEVCGAQDETLHVHHGCYIRGREPWDYESAFLHVLCEGCHSRCEAVLAHINKGIGLLPPDTYGLMLIKVKELLKEIVDSLGHPASSEVRGRKTDVGASTASPVCGAGSPEGGRQDSQS